MIEEFNKNTFYSFLIHQNVPRALEYLTKFPEKSKLLKKYQRIFIKRQIRPKKINHTIDSILIAYAHYYIDVLHDQTYHEDALRKLVHQLQSIMNLENKITDMDNACFELGSIEKTLEEVFSNMGYYFLGGDTSGVYGPYIWRETKEQWYNVDIPSGTIKVKVTMMDKFISKSWLDFITFSKVGINNWYSSNSGLFCLKSMYRNGVDKPKFLISFLKHEAQHLYDVHVYGKMKAKDLEYRAFLVELIYYPNISKLKSLFGIASPSNQESHGSYAAYIIISRLSKMIFYTNYESNFSSWKGKVSDVQKKALILYHQHTSDIRNSYSEEVDII